MKNKIFPTLVFSYIHRQQYDSCNRFVFRTPKIALASPKCAQLHVFLKTIASSHCTPTTFQIIIWPKRHKSEEQISHKTLAFLCIWTIWRRIKVFMLFRILTLKNKVLPKNTEARRRCSASEAFNIACQRGIKLRVKKLVAVLILFYQGHNLTWRTDSP